MIVTCPGCQTQVEIAEMVHAPDVACPTCGRAVSCAEYATKPEPCAPPQVQVGKYRLMAKLGEGTYSTVWRARDPELNRNVAVKVSRPGPLGQRNVQRFMHEARAASNLKHHGIAAIHQIGYEADICFIVYDFIDGINLGEWMNDHRADPREATELMIQIADALGHAHQNAVVHRDIKPANIMLRVHAASDTRVLATLQPVIVDFGLAKQLDAASAITGQGRRVGTPAYMSPEQARGDSHLADARSDVWSLGVILYELLTGELPFRGRDRMLLVQIQYDDPKPPRRLNDQVHRELESITLKCLAKDPSRRYQSAAELTDDLRRYVNGVPVLARPVTPMERFWRWTKRNPRVAGLSVAVALLLVTVAVGSAYIALERQATAEFLVDKNRQLIAMSQIARVASRRAQDHAEVARDQSQLALNTLKSIIFDFQSKLDDIPGSSELQRELLETAVARLQEVSEQFAARQSIDHSTHAALIALGDLILRIGTPSTPQEATAAAEDESPSAVARRVFGQALDIAHQLVAAAPTDDEALEDLAVSYSRLGDLYLRTGQVTDALGHYERMLELRQRIAHANPTSVSARMGLAYSKDRMSEALIRSAQFELARQHITDGIRLSRTLPAEAFATLDNQRQLASLYERLGDVCRRDDRIGEAMDYYQQALEIRHTLDAQRQDSLSQRQLSISYSRLGQLRSLAGDVAEALKYFQDALQFRQKLVLLDPMNSQIRCGLAIAYKNLANVSFQARQFSEAREYHLQSIEISEGLARDDPMNARARRNLACSYEGLGDLSLQAEQTSEGLEHYKTALEIRLKLAALDESNVEDKFGVAVGYGKVADAQQKHKQYKHALESYGQALNLMVTLKDQNRLAAAFEDGIASTQRSMALCQRLMEEGK